MKNRMIFRRIMICGTAALALFALCACSSGQGSADSSGTEAQDETIGEYESAEGRQIRMTADGAEIIITLNDSRAAADLFRKLPLEMELIKGGRTSAEH